MSLKAKIFSSFMLLVLMLVIAGVMSIMEFRKVGSSVDTVMDNNYKSVEQAKLMLDALEREDSGLLMFLMGNKEQGINIISSADSTMTKAIDVAKNNITETNEEQFISEVIKEYSKFYNSIKGTIEKNEVLTTEQKSEVYSKENQQLFLSTKKAIYSLMKINEDGIYKQNAGMKENAKRAIMPAIVSIVVAILFAFLLNFFINEYFVSPIRKIKDAVASFYPEQNTLKVNIKSKDEIKGLENEINNLIFRLLRKRNPNE